jgi:hypothetical protein
MPCKSVAVETPIKVLRITSAPTNIKVKLSFTHYMARIRLLSVDISPKPSTDNFTESSVMFYNSLKAHQFLDCLGHRLEKNFRISSAKTTINASEARNAQSSIPSAVVPKNGCMNGA